MRQEEAKGSGTRVSFTRDRWRKREYGKVLRSAGVDGRELEV